MGTTQTAISRYEDPSYGKMTLQSLFELSHAFDTGLRVEFVSTINMLNATFRPDEAARHVPMFKEECDDVVFYINAVGDNTSITTAVVDNLLPPTAPTKVSLVQNQAFASMRKYPPILMDLRAQQVYDYLLVPEAASSRNAQSA